MNVLTRHFFDGLLRPESASGEDSFVEWLAQMLGALIAASWLFPAYFLPFRYVYLHTLPTARRYQEAVAGDFLMALCLLMLAVALVTAVEWPMLFPSRRDHLVLSPLPIAKAHLFGAKLAAVLLFVSFFIAATAVVAGVTLPAIATGAHEPRGLWLRIAAHVVGALCACYATFFTLFALQGVLVGVLPARWCAPASFGVQCGLLLGALCALPLLPYLPARLMLGTVWFPPAWFGGVTASLMGESHPLAGHGWLALASALLLTLVTYGLAYTRFSQQATEVTKTARGAWLPWRASGIGPFLLLTLARGRDQKLAWLLIGGLGVALLAENFVYLTRRIDRHGWEAIQANFRGSMLAVPLMLSYFVLAGLRRAFRLPADPPANWLFRFAESEPRRAEWLGATWRIFVACGVVAPLVVCFPAQVLLLGPWRACGVFAWQLMLAFALAHHLMTGWNAVPFTSTHHPARRHLIHSMIGHLGLFVPFVFLGAMAIEDALTDVGWAVAWSVALVALLCWTRQRRLAEWGREALTFAETDGEAMTTLGLS